MSDRTARASDRTLSEWVANLRTDVDALKVGPQAFGPDALQIQHTGRASGYDVSVSVSPGATVRYRFTFTPTSLQNAYVEFAPQVDLTNISGKEVVTVSPDVSNTSATSSAWIVSLANSTRTVGLNIGAAFRCTDTGTISVASA